MSSTAIRLIAIIAALVLPFPFSLFGGSMNPKTLAIVAAAALAAIIADRYIGVSKLLA